MRGGFREAFNNPDPPFWKFALRAGNLFEKFALEQQHVDNSDGNIAVGQVKDRTEKEERFTAHPRQPTGVHTAKKREIKHVNHLAVQETGISASFGKKSRDAGKGRLRKEQPVNALSITLPTAPAKISVKPTSTPVGAFLRSSTAR